MTNSRIYLQATTGKLHTRKDCSVSSRTRYSHFDVTDTITADEVSALLKCHKCWRDGAGVGGRS